MVENQSKRFIRLFNEVSRYKSPYTVFSDFVTMSAISLHNAAFPDAKLEEEYLSMINAYDRKHVDIFPQLLACCVEALEDPQDFLGSLYMELELGNSHTGQYFTPYSVSQMMVAMLCGDSCSLLEREDFITLSEPAVGSGGTVIAFAENMLKSGYNPQKQLWVQCVDVDATVAMMAYVQLSLLHIPAEVIVGNSLSLETTRTMRTPAHHLGLWQYKLKARYAKDESDTVIEVPGLSSICMSPLTKSEQMTLSF